MPFYAINNSYSNADINAVMGVTGSGTGFEVGSTGNGLGNLFQPGVLQGAAPTLTMLTADTNAYNTDKNNLAPSVGVAWTVGSDKGFLHKFLGSPGDSVIRGGFTRGLSSGRARATSRVSTAATRACRSTPPATRPTATSARCRSC